MNYLFNKINQKWRLITIYSDRISFRFSTVDSRDWNVFVLVYRCDDDWYLIELDKDQQTSYWKCDQITGIIDFLENIDDIKIIGYDEEEEDDYEYDEDEEDDDDYEYDEDEEDYEDEEEE